MSVFRNYDPRKAGGVNANAFPRVHPIPWTPTQRNVRSNPNIPSQPQRVQPHERGTFYPTSASAGGTLAASPSLSDTASGCGGGCGGCGGGVAAARVSDMPTAVDNATSHSLPAPAVGAHSNMLPTPIKSPIEAGFITPRVQSRTTGALRPVPRTGTVRLSTTPVRAAGGGGMMGGRSGL